MDTIKVRKHVSQMTEADIIYCSARVLCSAQEDITITGHAQVRLISHHIYIPDIKKLLMQDFRVVECEKITTRPRIECVGEESIPVPIPSHIEERIVVRMPYSQYSDISLCINTTDNCLVTAWTNGRNDHHENIDMSIYTKELKLW